MTQIATFRSWRVDIADITITVRGCVARYLRVWAAAGMETLKGTGERADSEQRRLPETVRHLDCRKARNQRLTRDRARRISIPPLCSGILSLALIRAAQPHLGVRDEPAAAHRAIPSG